MNEPLAAILAVIAAYFIGSIPSAYIGRPPGQGIDITHNRQP
jgi:glycerol-3-phosphate acyltransferase PlsY